MPAERHFLKRQYWQRLRFSLMTRHLPSRKQRYSICFWMLRRKNPCQEKTHWKYIYCMTCTNSPCNPRRRLHHSGIPMPCRHRLCRAQMISRRHRCCCCCCRCCCCCLLGQKIAAAAGVATAAGAAAAVAAVSSAVAAAVALQGKIALVYTFPPLESCPAGRLCNGTLLIRRVCNMSQCNLLNEFAVTAAMSPTRHRPKCHLLATRDSHNHNHDHKRNQSTSVTSNWFKPPNG